MKVYKFGGASVKNGDGVRNLRKIIEGETELFVIVSAMGKSTNALERVFDGCRTGDRAKALAEVEELRRYHYEIIADLFGNADLRIARVEALFGELAGMVGSEEYNPAQAEAWYDRTVAFGELVSTTIVSEYLAHSGIANRWVDMRKCFLTQSRHKDANVLIDESAPLLRREIAGSRERVFVGQGFIGAAADGSTTTLGREGSDYSAAVVANILDGESMTVWKDVEGVLNADPKIFREARKIDALNYVDTIELAYSGAQIIHPKTIKPLQNKNIPLYVKPFGDKTKPGTVINGEAAAVTVPIIILKRNQSLLTLRSRDLSFVLEEKFPIVFSTLERFRIKTNLIHNTAIALSLCAEESWHLEEAAEALRAEGFDAEIHTNMELLTIHHYNDEMFRRYAISDANMIRQTNTETTRMVRFPVEYE